MPLRAVIFDGFGTLFDGAPTLAASIEDAVQAAYERLLQEGHAVPAGEFRAAYAKARDKQKEARRTSNREFPIEERFLDTVETLAIATPDRAALAHRLADAHMAGFQRFLLVHPEAPDVLKDLSRTYKLGIASNYYHAAHLHEILKGVGIHGHFHAIVSSAEVGYCKPDPAMFHEVLRRLDVRPEDALMVGDTCEHDVEAPQRIGMHGCFVPNPREPPAKACPGAALTVARLGDLPAAIRARFGP